MLESIVSSKIRRALLEYILAHPQERVYLRGLAKQLDLSISPLRRELKRLEHLGVLKAYDEANIRFYVVDHTSPLFAQLQTWCSRPAEQHLSLDGQTPSTPTAVGAQDLAPAESSQIQPVVAAAVPSSKTVVEERHQVATPSWQTIVGGVVLSAFVAVVLGGVAYLAYTNQRLLMVTHQAVLSTKPKISVVGSSVAVVPTQAPVGPSASGQMHSSRWTLVPGAVGAGFSAGTRKESY